MKVTRVENIKKVWSYSFRRVDTKEIRAAKEDWGKKEKDNFQKDGVVAT